MLAMTALTPRLKNCLELMTVTGLDSCGALTANCHSRIVKIKLYLTSATQTAKPALQRYSGRGMAVSKLTRARKERKCPDCNGEGRICYLEEQFDGGHDRICEICDTCKGEGKVLSDVG